MKIEDEQKLKDYGQELGVAGPVTLEALVQSHRYLRKESRRTAEDRLLEVVNARDAARKAVLETEYVSVVKLRSMTLGELADFIAERD